MTASVLHADGLQRCPWPKQDTLYLAYHDQEWGVPEYDDRSLYEKLVLDGFQAGLSWITILRKRDNFRRMEVRITRTEDICASFNRGMNDGIVIGVIRDDGVGDERFNHG